MKRLITFILTSAGLALFYTNAVAATQVYGEYILDVTISVITPIPAGDSVYCDLTVGTTETTNSNSDTVLVQATVSGTPPTATARCTLTLPFEWLLSTPDTDVVAVTYDVAILPTNFTNVKEQAVRAGTHILTPVVGIPGHVTQLASVTTRL